MDDMNQWEELSQEFFDTNYHLTNVDGDTSPKGEKVCPYCGGMGHMDDDTECQYCVSRYSLETKEHRKRYCSSVIDDEISNKYRNCVVAIDNFINQMEGLDENVVYLIMKILRGRFSKILEQKRKENLWEELKNIQR